MNTQNENVSQSSAQQNKFNRFADVIIVAFVEANGKQHNATIGNRRLNKSARHLRVLWLTFRQRKIIQCAPMYDCVGGTGGGCCLCVCVCETDILRHIVDSKRMPTRDNRKTFQIYSHQFRCEHFALSLWGHLRQKAFKCCCAVKLVAVLNKTMFEKFGRDRMNEPGI